jgi:hypothetical protein
VDQVPQEDGDAGGAVNSQHVLWAIAGAAVAYVLLNRRRARAEAKAASVALVPALTDTHVDDGPDAELAAAKRPCCSKCAAKDGQTPPILVNPVPSVSLAPLAPTTVRTGYRMPRGPIKIYMGGLSTGARRPSSGAIITQKLGSGGTVR